MTYAIINSMQQVILEMFVSLLKEANEAAEKNHFDSAKTLAAECKELIDSVDENHQTELVLKHTRLVEYIGELESTKGDWLAQWYAGSASGQAIRDVNSGRCKIINL